MPLRKVLGQLRQRGLRANVVGRARFGIADTSGYGVSVPDLRQIARGLRPDHPLALELWGEGSLDARCLAAFIDDPAAVTPSQMDRWAQEFNSWAICDSCCLDLFRKTRFAWSKAFEWSRRPEEFVKRAGFALFA
ncbi:MAG: DNA alkylation repair protein, partial [Thermoplasmata archaeon]|nr:DNA alkylation repair protein [Thermoplasmata archaeon]